jgi:alpha-glucosidase
MPVLESARVADAVAANDVRDGDWWRTGVIYQIYPRSFADTNGDGLGDLPGIIDRLDHLAAPNGLGVDALWLSPIYPSPGLDGGYDVADHASVDPLFGSMADFDRLVEAAHERGIRVVLDLVLNHTSDRHVWFAGSRASRTGPYANWYIWRDALGRDRRGRPIPPNNWLSFFGGSAWTWDDARGQFYLHTFLPEQPDLNWREPAVRAAQWGMVRAWLDHGVDGFRMDVFNALLKAESLASNPPSRRVARRPWDRQHHLHDKDQADLFPLLDEFRAILDEAPGRMSVGEMFSGDVPKAVALSRPGHLVFDFSLLEQPWSARAFRRTIAAREAAFGDTWPTVVLSNHDRSRHVSRYLRSLRRDDPETHDRVAKAAAALLLTLRGTPFLYYGEEIGLPDVDIPRAQIVDPPARRSSWRFPWWNRDQCRSPMPWTSDRNGGFTTGRPWLPMAPDAAERNVERQAASPESVLAMYQQLLALRQRLEPLSGGRLEVLSASNPDVLAYLRELHGQRVLVVINFKARHQETGLPSGRWHVELSTAGRKAGGWLEGSMRLGPLEAVIASHARPGE